MIYLKPIGGLCNRMRSIESVLALCRKFQKDLTVLWVRDASLNTSFFDLFQEFESEKCTISIIDCPVGYPENYLGKSPLLAKINPAHNTWRWLVSRKVKNLIKGRRVSNELRNILSKLELLSEKHLITNNDLSAHYPSAIPGHEMNIRAMDQTFLENTTHLVAPLIKNSARAVYLSNCYRIHPLTGHYDAFVPIPSIQAKIQQCVKGFNEKTIGIHIRRTDHVTATSVSTLEKFTNLMDCILLEDPETNFFLSTDDSDTKDDLIDRYGDKILYNIVSSYARDNSDAAIYAVVDLYCLSRTKKIYGSHQSSFSQTAADIGGFTEKAVV